MLLIKKPRVLISLYIRNGQRYSAGGWIAHEVGLSVTDGARSFLSRSDDVPYTELIAEKLQSLKVHVKGEDIWELDQMCDAAPMDQRIELFCDWCEKFGIGVK